MKLWEIDSQVMRLMKGMISGEDKHPLLMMLTKASFPDRDTFAGPVTGPDVTS